MKDVDTIEMIKKHEGLRLKPYKCTSGKLTIGYGRNLEDNGISKHEAELLLTHDVFRCIEQLQENLPWMFTLTHNRQAVLIDMCFNLGINGLLKFKNTLREISEGNYQRAADNMLKSLWAKQVGVRAHYLAQLMRNG